MNITLNAIQYKNNSSGIGQFIFNLYNEIVNELERNHLGVNLDIITSKNSPLFSFENNGDIHVQKIPFNKEQVLQRNIYELFFLGRAIDKNCEAYFSLDAKLPLFLRPNLKKILAITDLAVYRMGEVYQASRTFYWKKLFKYSIQRADHIVAISEFTKNEIVDILKIDPRKISVVYTAAGESFRKIEDQSALESVRKKYGLNFPFLLFVGTFSPRKNLYRLIQAYEHLVNEKEIPHRLVIVGEKGWKFNNETKLLQESRVAEKVIFPGYVPDEDLPVIYNLAEATVFPSIYEGFGIPVIESMACGTPVALSNTSCLPEVAGDAGVYFDPYDIHDISKKVYMLLQEKAVREQMIMRGFERAGLYSWEKAAKQLLDIIIKTTTENGKPFSTS